MGLDVRHQANLLTNSERKKNATKIGIMLLLEAQSPKTPYACAQAHVPALTQSKAGKVALSTVRNAPLFLSWTAPACFEQASRRFIAGKSAQNCTL
ncbi:hypothetical protein [Janthinobacterium sp. HLS12-2]|uniref:hypothetical protein n=1 Tax=Janthinobacterium sp. HLS12-2 TaxID=1259324 RepID=UPI003F271003